MKLVVYGPDRRLGLLQGERLIDLNHAYAKYLKESQNEPLPYEMAAAIVPSELGAFIVSGERALEGAQRAAEHLANAADQKGLRGERLFEAVADVKLHAPYAQGARIMMGGGNYPVHSQGMGYRGTTGERQSLEAVYADQRKRGIWGFYCFTQNAVASGDDVVYPARTDRLDYEGEIAVVLGKPAKDVKAADAAPYYWGYMLQNDISARTQIAGGRDNPQSSFARGKNFDTSIVGGPCVVVGELPDAQNITWETRVNGDLRQSGNTKDMTYKFGELLEYLTADMTLNPGDVISAGTTAGTAQDSSDLLPTGDESMGLALRDPKLFLKPGDVVEITNSIIGTLRNRIVAKS